MSYFNKMVLMLAVFIFLGAKLLPHNSISFVPFNIKPKESGLSASSFHAPRNSVFNYMDKSVQVIEKELGKPERIDPTQYGYKWWIYGMGSEKYIQIGIDNQTHRVTTMYVLGDQLKTEPFTIGSTPKPVYNKEHLTNTIAFVDQGTAIKFELTKEDMSIRPLVKYGNGWLQLAIDHVTHRIMAVRYMSPDVLVKLKPYTVMYLGTLHQAANINNKEWDKVDQAESKEIFDMTNILRKRYGQKTLKWSPAAADAAFKHSKEMYDKHYFSHDSKWSGNLGDRLQHENITFRIAGENIAAHYPDSAASVLGWMNSIDHRKNFLSSLFNELGVGVYHAEYTQDFVHPYF